MALLLGLAEAAPERHRFRDPAFEVRNRIAAEQTESCVPGHGTASTARNAARQWPRAGLCKTSAHPSSSSMRRVTDPLGSECVRQTSGVGEFQRGIDVDGFASPMFPRPGKDLSCHVSIKAASKLPIDFSRMRPFPCYASSMLRKTCALKMEIDRECVRSLCCEDDVAMQAAAC